LRTNGSRECTPDDRLRVIRRSAGRRITPSANPPTLATFRFLDAKDIVAVGPFKPIDS